MSEISVSYVAGTPLRIGNETQLLLDDQIIEDRWRLERDLNRPTKHPANPIVTPEKPWESEMTYRPWVLWDDDAGRYRMWYQTFSRSGYSGASDFPAYAVCYAESADGINWDKPSLDVVTLPGYDETNIVYAGEHEQRVQGVQVIKDEGEPDPDRRYKMLCTIKRERNGELHSGVSLAYSPDGIHWSLETSEPHLLDYHSDTFNHAVYDPETGRWRLYCRPIHMYAAWPYPTEEGMPDEYEGDRHTRRRVAVATARELRSDAEWSYPRTCLYPDERGPPDIDQAYVFRYGGHYIMAYGAMYGDGAGWQEVRLASSADGINWRRWHGRKPFLPRGAEGEWDHGQAIWGCRPVPHGEHLLLYYTGTFKPQYRADDLGSIGVARLKQDRFVAQRAGDEPGFLLTREFILEGNRLVINVTHDSPSYSPRYVRAELCRHPPMGGHGDFSQPYEGFEMASCDGIRGDNTAITMTWRGGDADIGQLRGEPVYLRLQLRNMGIYSFRIAET